MTGVIDGDTVDLTQHGGTVVRIGVLGIDTPETTKRGWTAGCWGPQARSMLLDQVVTVSGDPTQDTVDRYGRTLAYLTLPDGRDYSAEAARAGAAHSYTYQHRPASKTGQIAAAETTAKAAGRG